MNEWMNKHFNSNCLYPPFFNCAKSENSIYSNILVILLSPIWLNNVKEKNRLKAILFSSNLFSPLFKTFHRIAFVHKLWIHLIVESYTFVVEELDCNYITLSRKVNNLAFGWHLVKNCFRSELLVDHVF